MAAVKTCVVPSNCAPKVFANAKRHFLFRFWEILLRDIVADNPEQTKQARKLGRCDSYLQSETINDPLTHSLTGVGDVIASKKCKSHSSSRYFVTRLTGANVDCTPVLTVVF